MAALGMLMSFAKREPGAREVLAARGENGVRRALSWLGLNSAVRNQASSRGGQR
jgi:cell division protein FtsW